MHETFDICGNVAAFKFAGLPFEDAQSSLRLYAKEVMPELKKLARRRRSTETRGARRPSWPNANAAAPDGPQPGRRTHDA